MTKKQKIAHAARDLIRHAGILVETLETDAPLGRTDMKLILRLSIGKMQIAFDEMIHVSGVIPPD